MAYFRGDTYIWSDGDNLHLWSHNGMDSWDTTGWCLDEDEQRYPGYENASGVSVPEKIVDQLSLHADG